MDAFACVVLLIVINVCMCVCVYRSSNTVTHGDFSVLTDEQWSDIHFLFAVYDTTLDRVEAARALESMTANLWLYITGASGSRLKFQDSGIFSLNGEAQLVYIDQPYAQWSTTPPNSDLMIKRISGFCRFPEHIARRILILAPQPPHTRVCSSQVEREVTLADLVRNTLQLLGIESWLSDAEAKQLNANLLQMAGAIRHCMLHDGERRALVNDPWVRESNLFEFL
jgi:hypothetical protein